MTTRKILLVDDEANVLAAYKRQLRKRFEIETAAGATEALEALEEKGPYAVVVSDMTMPVMNGIALLEKIMTKAPMTVRLMLTGNADQKTAMDAVNEGHVFRFLTKPIEPEDFAEALDEALAHYRLQAAEKELLEQTLAGSVKLLVDLLSIVDEQAFGRGTVLRRWAHAMASALGLPQPWAIEMAAMLARIGEVTLPQELRGGRAASAELSDLERQMLERVPEIGRELIDHIPRMKAVAEIVHYQNKRYDGGGFPPDGTAGKQIPVGARLLKILDALYDYGSGTAPGEAAFEALTSDRGAYDPALLAVVRGCEVLLRPDHPTGGQSEAIEVSAAALVVGDRLATNVKTLAGDLVLAKDYELTGPVIEKLRNLVRLKHVREPIRVLRRLPPMSGAAE